MFLRKPVTREQGKCARDMDLGRLMADAQASSFHFSPPGDPHFPAKGGAPGLPSHEHQPRKELEDGLQPPSCSIAIPGTCPNTTLSLKTSLSNVREKLPGKIDL